MRDRRCHALSSGEAEKWRVPGNRWAGDNVDELLRVTEYGNLEAFFGPVAHKFVDGILHLLLE